MSADEFDFELCLSRVEAHHREVEALKSELAAARAVIAAAEAMREDTCHGNALEAFDAALAEYRKAVGR